MKNLLTLVKNLFCKIIFPYSIPFVITFLAAHPCSYILYDYMFDQIIAGQSVFFSITILVSCLTIVILGIYYYAKMPWVFENESIYHKLALKGAEHFGCLLLMINCFEMFLKRNLIMPGATLFFIALFSFLWFIKKKKRDHSWRSLSRESILFAIKL